MTPGREIPRPFHLENHGELARPLSQQKHPVSPRQSFFWQVTRPRQTEPCRSFCSPVEAGETGVLAAQNWQSQPTVRVGGWAGQFTPRHGPAKWIRHGTGLNRFSVAAAGVSIPGGPPARKTGELLGPKRLLFAGNVLTSITTGEQRSSDENRMHL